MADTDDDEIKDEGFILLSELRDGDGELRVPLHPHHIAKLVKRGEFPPKFKVGGRIAFRRRDIRAWSRSRPQVTG